jgi:hypothetical protein
MTRSRIIWNVVVYQIVWIVCVAGAGAGLYAPGIIAAVLCVAWHVSKARHPRRELALVALAATLGAAFETALFASGWVHMPSSALLGNLTPIWMVCLWAAFATTLNVSLRFLRERLILSSLVGAVGAPLAYHAGAGMGALLWVEVLPALLAVAAAWALLTPLLMVSARRLDGYAA